MKRLSGMPGDTERPGAFGSFDSSIWSYVDYRPRQNAWKTLPTCRPDRNRKHEQGPKKRGFNFVGPTICYAFMQAVGMVNDHTIDCFRYEAVNKIARRDTAVRRHH